MNPPSKEKDMVCIVRNVLAQKGVVLVLDNSRRCGRWNAFNTEGFCFLQNLFWYQIASNLDMGEGQWWKYMLENLTGKLIWGKTNCAGGERYLLPFCGPDGAKAFSTGIDGGASGDSAKKWRLLQFIQWRNFWHGLKGKEYDPTFGLRIVATFTQRNDIRPKAMPPGELHKKGRHIEIFLYLVTKWSGEKKDYQNTLTHHQ